MVECHRRYSNHDLYFHTDRDIEIDPEPKSQQINSGNCIFCIGLLCRFDTVVVVVDDDDSVVIEICATDSCHFSMSEIDHD